MSDNRPDPLADPLAAPDRHEGPQCPVHGQMRLKSRGCGFLCYCKPPRFECGGFDGEGCSSVAELDNRALAVLRRIASDM